MSITQTDFESDNDQIVRDAIEDAAYNEGGVTWPVDDFWDTIYTDIPDFDGKIKEAKDLYRQNPPLGQDDHSLRPLWDEVCDVMENNGMCVPNRYDLPNELKIDEEPY